MRTLLLLLALVSGPGVAQWQQATGEAIIVDGDVAKAREQAVAQAISYAGLASGASFNAEQQVVNGRLTQNTLTLAQMLMTNRIELISEEIRHNKLTVKLQLELLDDVEPNCAKGQLKAAIFLPQAQIRDRAQLRHGQLTQLPAAISRRLGAQLERTSSTGFIHLAADKVLAMGSGGNRLPSWLADSSDSQYVLLPELMDVATEPAESSMLGLWHSDPLRQFRLRLTLYHGISGEVIWQNELDTSAPWEFELQASVDPDSDRFWRSAYGRGIDKLLADAGRAMDEALMCRPVLGQVVAREGETLIINLGRRHGLKNGDELQLVLTHNIGDRLSRMRTLANNSHTNIKIEQVTEDSAIAVLKGQQATLNIQLNDIAIKI
ncbi:flagellar assembly protein FlgT [Shewanella cyperi]|uniref:flagellar assembly protein FlgT n=1 Tax=Shewanella cyperi TaxID=2814292 RepID=UPI001A9503CF|nr:flagellar assembly protein FlgT [Shewanella cyperi]QSX39712.1 flagella assembly protein FlgT [Shewanella cyperi]